MTRLHDDHEPPAGVGASRPAVGGALGGALDAERAERIRAELAALGEDPAADDELGFASTPAAAPDDVRTVATLVELSAWVAPAEGLLPLTRHRVWQRVASRMPPASAGRQAHGVVPPTGGLVAAFPTNEGGPAVEPAANSGGSPWRGVLASLALVAGVVLVLHVDVAPPLSDEDRAVLESTGEAARLSLGTVPGEQDGTRARALAEGYAERLSAARGAER
jgi:hypothetical protein